MGGQTARMSFWHRPLHATTGAFTAAGFRISVISEPQPAPAARELFPVTYGTGVAPDWIICAHSSCVWARRRERSIVGHCAELGLTWAGTGSSS